MLTHQIIPGSGISRHKPQGSKIPLVRSYLRAVTYILYRSLLRVPKVEGQVKILIFLVKFNFFPVYANNFCDAGQVPNLRYFEA